jgi:MFS family permease
MCCVKTFSPAVGPLLVTVVSVGPGHKYYINPYYCRATEWPFWLGLILPFSVIILFDWVVFAIIMTKLLRRKVVKVDIKMDSKKNYKEKFILAIGLSLLLGLGWGLGLTATSSDVKEVTFVFQILFSLFVGSQGVLIFIFHGLRSPQFRQTWTSAFGLRSKRKAPKYYSKKRSTSGPESNTTSSGATMSGNPFKQLWSTLNRSSESSHGPSSTGMELGESAFESTADVQSSMPEIAKDDSQKDEENK